MVVGERRNVKALTFSLSHARSGGHTRVAWVRQEERLIPEVENVIFQKPDLNSKGQTQNCTVLSNYFSTFLK